MRSHFREEKFAEYAFKFTEVYHRSEKKMQREYFVARA